MTRNATRYDQLDPEWSYPPENEYRQLLYQGGDRWYEIHSETENDAIAEAEAGAGDRWSQLWLFRPDGNRRLIAEWQYGRRQELTR